MTTANTRRELIIGTRGSALAMRQTNLMVTALQRHHPELVINVREIHTQGDADQTTSLRVLGGQGIFVKAIEAELAAGTIDLAIHSLKDLPPALHPDLVLGAVPKRADAHDVLIAREGWTLATLPPGATVGTGSARRAAQLHAVRPDLVIADLRGNVDTRLTKSLDPLGLYDAIVLALAGLQRLEHEQMVTEILPFDIMLPAPGQGALGLEVRGDDAWTRDLIAPLNHPPTAAAITAERAFLAELGVGCQEPVAALGDVTGNTMGLTGLLARPDGSLVSLAMRGSITEADTLGRELARRVGEVGMGHGGGVEVAGLKARAE